jgi:hypothetical protein
VKIVVSRVKVELYVNGATQPALIVNDLKLGDVAGQIGLWVHSTTDGYFSDIKAQTEYNPRYSQDVATLWF